eukprot:364905-Chlamydomonas_euryale.AAC.6
MDCAYAAHDCGSNSWSLSTSTQSLPVRPASVATTSERGKDFFHDGHDGMKGARHSSCARPGPRTSDSPPQLRPPSMRVGSENVCFCTYGACLGAAAVSAVACVQDAPNRECRISERPCHSGTPRDTTRQQLSAENIMIIKIRFVVSSVAKRTLTWPNPERPAAVCGLFVTSPSVWRLFSTMVGP